MYIYRKKIKLLFNTYFFFKIRNIISSKTDKIQLNPIGPVAPGQLQLPEEDFWIVSVTCVMSTIEIWVRIVGDAYSVSSKELYNL